MSLIDELLSMATRLDEIASKLEEREIGNPIDRLEKTCLDFGKAASGSWFGYHANIYYKDFQAPPPGAHFSVEWGRESAYGISRGTEGEWYECNPDGVRAEILEQAKIKDDLALLRKRAKNTRKEVEEMRLNMLSILSRLSETSPADLFLSDCRTKVKNLEPFSVGKVISVLRDRAPTMTRDWSAATAGRTAPPHLVVYAEVLEIKSPFNNAGELAAISRSLAAHFGRTSLPSPTSPRARQKIRKEAKLGHEIHIHGDLNGGLQLDSPHALQQNSASTIDIERSVRSLKEAIISSSLSELQKEEASLALDRISVLAERPKTPETAKAISGKVEDVKSIAASAGSIAAEMLLEVVKKLAGMGW